MRGWYTARMPFAPRPLCLGCLLVVSGCGSTGWQPSSPVNATSPEARLIALYDLNQDLVLDEAEFTVHASSPTDFPMADLDANGVVDAPEMRQLLWTIETGPRGMGGGKEEREHRREQRRQKRGR